MERVNKTNEPVEEKKGFRYRMKHIVGWCSLLLGTVLAVYVGIWLMLIKPLIGLYMSYKAGKLHFMLVVVAVLKCWLSLTVAGTIWTVGYIGKCKFE